MFQRRMSFILIVVDVCYLKQMLSMAPGCSFYYYTSSTAKYNPGTEVPHRVHVLTSVIPPLICTVDDSILQETLNEHVHSD